MEWVIPRPMDVLEALQELYPDSSHRTLKNWLVAGRFTIDGQFLKKRGQLQEGQTLCSRESFCRPRIRSLSILYEDRFLIAIDKPAGLLSVPLDDGTSKRHALGLLRRYSQTASIFAVHRIDRESSGVLLFAKGKEAAERLNGCFERHELKREYFAIVEGRLKEQQGKWDHPLLELPNYRVIPSPEGKPATTHFEVLRRSAKYTYLRLFLETGRKHQIRVHCQMVGHPILGDRRYGSTESPIGRLCLHARSLELRHPFTKKSLSFIAPLPRPFLGMVTSHLFSRKNGNVHEKLSKAYI